MFCTFGMREEIKVEIKVKIKSESESGVFRGSVDTSNTNGIIL
jgi:hypothetical protein